MQVVVITSPPEELNRPKIKVRRTYKGQPYGKEIFRHVVKHGCKIHGENVIRHDYMN